MAHEWVLDVLADLQSFADANDLSALAAHLEDAGLIAAADIASQNERNLQQSYGEAIPVRAHPTGTGCHNPA